MSVQVTVTYPFGSTVRFTARFTDPSRHVDPIDALTADSEGTFGTTGDTLVDPSTITAKLKKPDASVTTKVFDTDVEVVRDAVGIYHIDVACAAAGDYVIGWIGTGVLPAQRELAFKVGATAF